MPRTTGPTPPSSCRTALTAKAETGVGVTASASHDFNGSVTDPQANAGYRRSRRSGTGRYCTG